VLGLWRLDVVRGPWRTRVINGSTGSRAGGGHLLQLGVFAVLGVALVRFQTFLLDGPLGLLLVHGSGSAFCLFLLLLLQKSDALLQAELGPLVFGFVRVCGGVARQARLFCGLLILCLAVGDLWILLAPVCLDLGCLFGRRDVGVAARGRGDEGLLDKGGRRGSRLEGLNWGGSGLVEGGNAVAEGV
jgi:hypothetical protein